MFRSQGGQKYESERSFQNKAHDSDDNNDDNQRLAKESRLVKEDNGDAYKSNMQEFREVCGAMVNHEKVQNGIIILIAINAAMMGIGTFPFVNDDPKVEAAFILTDKIFVSIFTAELGMQIIYLGFRLFLDGWLVFDFLIIVISWSFDTIGFVRAFRVFRALRLITRVKVMKNLVLALFSVLPRMGAIGLLLLLISYIFAVMLTQLFKDLRQDGFTDYDYFGRLDKTFFTLFQLMTLDGWSNIARQVVAVYKCKSTCYKTTIRSSTINQLEYQSCFVQFVGGWIPIMCFVSISGFIVVNLIVAVICEAVSNLGDDDKAKIHGEFVENNKEVQRLDLHEQVDFLEEKVNNLHNLQKQSTDTLQTMLHHITMNTEKSLQSQS